MQGTTASGSGVLHCEAVRTNKLLKNAQWQSKLDPLEVTFFINRKCKTAESLVIFL